MLFPKRRRNLQLTEHFVLDEFTASETAHELGIDNVPTDEHLGHLKILAAAMERCHTIDGGTAGARSAAICLRTEGERR